MTTTIRWDSSTAYDFFISLFVLHHAIEFGLRPSWAAGVRQRIPSPKREFLEKVYSFAAVPLEWIYDLPNPKDAVTTLRSAADLAPADRFEALTLPSDIPAEVRETLRGIAVRGAWTSEEKDFLGTQFSRRGKELKPAGLENLLRVWSKSQKSGDLLQEALNEYYQVFFAEEEHRVRPALEQGLERAQKLAGRLAVDALVDELSRGVRFEELESVKELVLVPSYWSAPLVFRARPKADKALIVFGARPEVESVAPGAETPDLLVSALKSLGDPTRLRILRYLAGQPLTPTELARRLRLRPPTVIHHLRALRLAGLVSVIVSEDGEKRYTARLEALNGIYTSLQDFLKKQD